MPPWDRCRQVYGVPVLGVHIRMCKRIALLYYYRRSLEAHGHAGLSSMGGDPTPSRACPPHEDLAPPIPKILSPPPR